MRCNNIPAPKVSKCVANAPSSTTPFPPANKLDSFPLPTTPTLSFPPSPSRAIISPLFSVAMESTPVRMYLIDRQHCPCPAMHCVSLANNQPANYLGSQNPPHGHESPLPERLPIVLTPRVSPLDPRTLSFFDLAPLPRKQDLFPAPMTLHSPTDASSVTLGASNVGRSNVFLS